MKLISKVLPSIYLPVIFILGYLLLILGFLKNYLIFDIHLLAGLILFPYILRLEISHKTGYRYLWLSVFFMLLSGYTGVATFYFLSVGLAIFFVLESMAGRINWLPIILLGILCPAFKYFNNIFGFAIRLKLSEIAGQLIHMLGINIEVTGNIMVMDNCEFSVDPACIGLKMMQISLLAGLVLMAYFERKSNCNFSFVKVMIITSIIIFLNITGNLLRILVLVLFRILPENPAHDLVGILCLVFYTIVPAYFIIKQIAPKKQAESEARNHFLNFKLIVLQIILLGLSVITGFKINAEDHGNVGKISLPYLQGYSKTYINEEVTKFEKTGILVYIKPVRKFYGTEHNPMICWIGSGYEFKKINKKLISGKEIYIGILERGNDILYAGWWFDNGSYQTINQAEWRWRAFRGEEFFLVNVNCESESKLLEEIKGIVETK